ncbi:restriction endonuclease subunit S [Vibrio splendidus]|uniref:restriction endonuclease subunit S n=1 Tax=Vibrio splendidus TaxID=29497 RepID=UPI000769BB9F|nr:restriction endonuclease subunit S [Vibrio splendidus]
MIKQTDENSHWERVKLDDIQVRISNGANVTQHDQKVGYPISRIETIWNETIDFDRVKYIEEKDEEFVEKYKLQKGDILFSHINSDTHLGKTAIVKNTQQTLIHGINLLLIRLSDNVSSEFVNYQFKYLRYKGLFIAHAQRAVNQSSINQKKLKNFDFVLPPFNEQQRIVEKIEELFSELDSGIKSLTKAKQQIAVYRQALLKQAFEGKLTAQWREDNPDKLDLPEAIQKRLQTEREERHQQKLVVWKSDIAGWEENGEEGKKPTKPSKPKEFELISDKKKYVNSAPWEWHYLSTLSEVTGGLTKNSKRSSFDSQLPYLRVANVYANELRLDEIKSIGVLEHEIKRVLLQPGDLLIVEGNGSMDQIGRVAVWDDSIKPCVHQNHLIKARCYPSIIPEFALNFLMSPIGRELIVDEASSTSGLHTLSLSKVGNIYLPVPSLEEQREILDILDTKFTYIENTIENIDISLKKAELLRQSILKKAFSGQLVSPDLDDESASELLKKIAIEKEELAEKEKAEKAAARKKKATAKKTVKS